MVFFTCANCGESLKKNKVEKHYQTACAKNPIALTCVDCCKDFSAETYPAHTKCISEEEKYSAKGSAPRPSANKGELKQQKWQEIIHSVRDNHRNNLSKEEQMILDIIVKHENVPRKKNKFQNFLRSMMKNRYNAQAADSVFDKLETISKQNNKEQGNSDKQNKSMKEDEKENTSSVEMKQNGNNPEQGHEKEKLSKKERKEKRKREKYDAELKEVESNQNPQVEDGSENEPRKKKKKSKKEVAVMETENEREETGVSGDVEMADGEESKKKHKKNKAVTENGMSEDIVTEGKKSKKKFKNDTDIVEGEVHEDSGVVEEKKSKKKRKKGQNVADNLCDKEPTVKKIKEDTEEETTEEQTTAGQTKFNWQETIIKILDSRDNKEIQIKRLRKKVLAEFEATGGDSATSEKALAKFKKKVHHTPGVVVLKDVAKLVGTD